MRWRTNTAWRRATACATGWSTRASPETVIFCDADGVTPARAERLQPLLERHQGRFYVIGTGERPGPQLQRRARRVAALAGVLSG